MVCSDYIRLQPAPAPDAPKIAATVVGFDERRQIEKITCDLVNKRDRYDLIFFLQDFYAPY